MAECEQKVDKLLHVSTLNMVRKLMHGFDASENHSIHRLIDTNCSSNRLWDQSLFWGHWGHLTVACLVHGP